MHKGVLIATAAASLFLAGAVTARAGEKAGGDTVNCLGVNACKGQGSCATAHNECKGMNACKGKGVVEMSAADCKAKGGTVQEPKKEME
ncbi:MAG TPA: hypothetical protein VKW76_14855 [Candidatus Binatia bacterium]|nr:hypothetical protein [Candidatus Binatia bacterium]